MLFNSIPFLLLFALTYCIYWISAQKWRKYILLLSSIVFYSYNSPYLMLHFGAVIAVNYLFAEQLLKRKLAGQDTG
ncbi:MAG TPA: MBOAT family protein, partial [Leptospiraceae bacterium]|nr:MBOAT family protein [Leptospiraceae bacterium]